MGPGSIAKVTVYNEGYRMPQFLRALLACMLLAIAGCSQADAPRPRTADAASSGAAVQPAASRPKVVFLGDSLTAGLGLPRRQAVPSLIQARLDAEGYGYEVVNAGVSGDTSAGGLRRLDWAIEGDVDVLVVELGANDGLRGLPVDQMKDNLDQIIERAKARGITVILTGMEAPPNYGPIYTSEFRRAFRDLADDHDVTFVPFFLDGVAGISALNNSDGIHPNAEGARIIGQTIWRALEPELDRQDQ
jgi:acyl-CoA thioesterase-1